MDFNPATIAPRSTSIADSVADLRQNPWILYVVGLGIALAIGVTVFMLIRKKSEKKTIT